MEEQTYEIIYNTQKYEIKATEKAISDFQKKVKTSSHTKGRWVDLGEYIFLINPSTQMSVKIFEKPTGAISIENETW